MKKLNDHMLRQGDVLVIVSDVPAEAIDEDRGERAVLAYGEATGHAHAIYTPQARMVQTPKKARFLRLVEPSMLKHEEHTHLLLDQPGYRVLRQTEWTDAQEPRAVAD